jgi:hypothetical protein
MQFVLLEHSTLIRSETASRRFETPPVVDGSEENSEQGHALMQRHIPEERNHQLRAAKTLELEWFQAAYRMYRAKNDQNLSAGSGAYSYIYRMFQGERALLRDNFSYVNHKHLHPRLNC